MSRDAHLKSMSSYESTAWNDACAIAQFMADYFENDVSRVRELYLKFEKNEIKAFEKKNESFIAEFIGKTEGQRNSYFNKITAKADERTKIIFLTLCLLSIIRVRDVIEIRDRYRDVLAPGRGYRLTNKALYEFEREVVGITTYEWPSDPFDAIDIDDGSCDIEPEEEEDFFPPEPPPPAEPPKPEQKYREIVVQHVQSKRFACDASGRIVRLSPDHPNGMWRFVGEDLREGKVFVGMVGNQKVGAAELRAAGIALLGLVVPDHETILVANKTLEGILAEHDEIGKRVFLAKAGVGQSAFVQWFDDYVDELLLEISLLGQAAPTVNELLAALPRESGVPVMLEAAAEDGNATQRRIELGKLAVKICEGRGMVLSDYLPSLHSPRLDPFSKVKRSTTLPKELRKLAVMHRDGRLSEFGGTLYEVFSAVDEWQRNPSSIQQGLKTIGDAVVKYVSQLPDNRYDYQTGRAFDEVLGSATPASDLVLAAVYRRLTQPVPAAWIEISRPAWHRQLPHQAIPGFFLAYWVEANVGRGRENETLRSLPYHHRISEELKYLLPDVQLRVDRDFAELRHDQIIDQTKWIQGWASWSSVLTNWLGSVKREDDNRPKKSLLSEAADGPRRILIIGRAATEEALQTAYHHQDIICRTIRDGIREGMAKAEIRGDVDVGSRLIPYVSPFVPEGNRFASIVLG